jgi:hypothetical protein
MVTLVLILYINGFGSPPAKVHLDYPSFKACYADLIDVLGSTAPPDTATTRR